MKKNTVNNPLSPEALLAEMPIEPSRSFADRVLADCEIEAMLREMPVDAGKDFAQKTVERAQIRHARPLRFRVWDRVAATGIAVAAVVAFLAGMNLARNADTVLASRVELAVNSDPELSQLAQEEPDSLSFDELLAASEILSTIDPAVLEIFAYND